MSISSFGIPSSPDRSEAMPAQACYLSASHEAAWVAVYQSVDAYTRGQVAAVVGDSLPQLVDTFYSVLLADNEAGPRLSHDIVATRLHSGVTKGTPVKPMQLFFLSNNYLSVLFVALSVDAVLGWDNFFTIVSGS